MQSSVRKALRHPSCLSAGNDTSVNFVHMVGGTLTLPLSPLAPLLSREPHATLPHVMYAAAQGPRATIRVTPGPGLTFNGIAQATTSDILTCKVRLHLRAPQADHSWHTGLAEAQQQRCALMPFTWLHLVGTSLLCLDA